MGTLESKAEIGANDAAVVQGCEDWAIWHLRAPAGSPGIIAIKGICDRGESKTENARGVRVALPGGLGDKTYFLGWKRELGNGYRCCCHSTGDELRGAVCDIETGGEII